MELGFTHIYEVEQGVEVLHEAISEYARAEQEIKTTDFFILSGYCPADTG
jgi:hypothetical protein